MGGHDLRDDRLRRIVNLDEHRLFALFAPRKEFVVLFF